MNITIVVFHTGRGRCCTGRQINDAYTLSTLKCTTFIAIMLPIVVMSAKIIRTKCQLQLFEWLNFIELGRRRRSCGCGWKLSRCRRGRIYRSWRGRCRRFPRWNICGRFGGNWSWSRSNFCWGLSLYIGRNIGRKWS